MAALRRAVVLLAALVLLVSTARAGAAYLYCVPMHAVMGAPCCHGGRAAQDGPAVERHCCEVQKVATPAPGLLGVAPSLALPPATTALEIEPAPALLLVVSVEPAAARAPRRFVEARAGPSSPIYLQNRTLLI